MTILELLKYLFPYFSGIRKLKQYITIEMVFPKTWEFPNEIISKTQVEQNDKYTGDGYFLIFACELNENFDNTLEVIFELISFNLEREEKERLLKSKVMELKDLFKNATLTDLKNLSISITKEEEDEINSLLEDDDEEENS